MNRLVLLFLCVFVGIMYYALKIDKDKKRLKKLVYFLENELYAFSYKLVELDYLFSGFKVDNTSFVETIDEFVIISEKVGKTLLCCEIRWPCEFPRSITYHGLVDGYYEIVFKYGLEEIIVRHNKIDSVSMYKKGELVRACFYDDMVLKLVDIGNYARLINLVNDSVEQFLNN